MLLERRGAITGASTGTTISSQSSLGSINSILDSYTSDTTSSGTTPSTSNSSGNTMSGFNFGSAPAPGPAPLFGAAPAPSTGAFSFGATAQAGTSAPLFGAPTSGSLFGNASNTTAAPAGGGLFGSSSGASGFGSPTPAGGGLFGNTAPAAAATSFGFGGPPAPATNYGTLASFGSPAPSTNLGYGTTTFGNPGASATAFGSATLTPAPVMPSGVAGFTPYSSLPPPQKQMIDSTFQAMMQHKRTVLAVQSMEPKLLEKPSSIVIQQADAAAGGPESVPLAVTVEQIAREVQILELKLNDLNGRMMVTKHKYETTTTQAITYAQWPTEAVAMRSGVTLVTNTAATVAADSPNASDAEQKKAEEVRQQLQNLLNRAAASVDRIERMPSPYLWQCIEDMEGRVQQLMASIQNLKRAVDIPESMSSGNIDVVAIARLHEEVIWKVGSRLANVHAKVDQVRQLYRHYERGMDVLELSNQEELHRRRQLDDKMKIQMIHNQASTTAPAAAAAPGSMQGGSLFGNTSGPSTESSNLWGGTPSLQNTPSSATAPGSFSFGGNPTPAPAGTSTSFSFGGSGTPAPASQFASAPAPISGGLFGSGTPAPSTSGFGSAPAAPAAFGTAPAAPAAFGATVPAPAFGAASAPAFGAAPATTTTTPAFGATSLTPKSKNKSRSTRRR
jgi:hypothetical protein